ncbi:MAG: TonB-dependent receptor plug domain-containing protein, partial [Gemmatimonadota bacterium]|nr:TonB-dependent receptor plug domain-containing protein [Gemmatimonadota bacterium]
MKSVPWLGLVVLLLASPLQVDAQQITGTVRDQASGSAVANAQVYIEALNLGVLTQSSGQYLLVGVPVGTHTVTVTSLGYRTTTGTVSVSEGGTGVLDFTISAEALQLDEILVTGTATGSRAREIGNAVGRLDASVAEVQPIINMSDLLRGRMPGVVIQQGSGDVGTASTIKIRGSSTMRLVNDGPLVYIDGVRASNRMESGGRDVSRIDDLDPAMIESLEVIKGPAAATLYGTEAANGVINITTKKGAVGEAQWNFTMRQGSQWFRDPAGRTPTNWGVNPNTGQIESLNILENKTERDLIFSNGHTQYYGIDVSGGSDRFRYFVAGSAAMDDGVTENSWANKYNGRLNITAQPSDNVTLSANAGIGLIRMRIPSDYPYEEAVYAGPADCARVPDRRCYRRGIPEARVARDFDYNNANRMTAGFTATHTPFNWLTHRLTFGTDLTNQAEDNLDAFLGPDFAPYYSSSSAAGGRRINRESVAYTTFDYAATGEKQLTDDLASTTSAGF